MEPKRQDRIIAAVVNVKLFSKDLFMRLKAVINGSVVGDSGGSTGVV